MTAETRNGDRIQAWQDRLTTDELAEVERIDSMPLRMGLGYLLVRIMRHEESVAPTPVWHTWVASLLGGGGIVGLIKAASELGFTL